MRVYGTKTRIEQLARDVDMAVGYPRAGRLLDGTVRLDGQGWTRTHALPEKADDGQWEYPTYMPERAQHLLIGLPQRKRTIKPEVTP